MKFIKKLTKRLTLFILAIILVGGPLLYLLSLNSGSAKAAWFDDNWAYRKAITVTVTSSSTDITNLETLLTIDTSTNLSGKIQSACQDLRFTSVSGKQLPYYIDSGCTGTTSKIWVLADLVPKNTTTYTMYMYYGNPSATSASSTASFSIPQGLVGYWPMNEASWTNDCSTYTVFDYSLNGNHGKACPNSTGPTGGATGQYGNAGSFDGNNDYINAGNSSAFNITGAMTLSAWVKITDNTRTWNIISSKWNDSGSGTDKFTFHFSVHTGKVSLYESTLGSDVGTESVGTTTLSNNIWYHVVAVVNTATDQQKVYLNGVQEGNIVSYTTASMPTVTQNLYIGDKVSTVGTTGMQGSIDDFRIYNRALSDIEISQLYTTPGSIASAINTQPTTSFATEETTPGPIAYWKFDDPSAGSGLVAQDSTSNNKDGTISGATWQTEDQCVAGKCLYFDGSNDVVTVSNTVSGIQTVSLWIKPITTSEQIIDINGTASISVSSGTISATNFTSPTIYVNGQVSSTLVANTWQYVTVTTATALSGSAIKIGQISTNYGQAFIDDVKLYPYARSAAQVLTDYNSRGSMKGASASFAAQQSKALSDGLVGYWKMDESAWSGVASEVNDSSGNGNNGISVNSATTGTGKFGNGGVFGSSNKYVNAANSSVFNLNISTFTFSAWLYPTTTQTGYTFIVNKDGSQTYAFGFDTNGYPYVAIYEGSWTEYPAQSSTLSTNTWHHFVAVRNSDNTLKFWIDGSPTSLSYTNVKTPQSNTSNNLTIGGDSRGSFAFNGTLDEVRVYNRALSSADVTALYTFAPGPVGYWSFDDGTSASAQDKSGNGNTGTWNGTLGSQWKPGKYGAGGSFNRSDNYIKASASSSSLKFGTGDFTVGAWVYFNAVNIGTGANAQSVVRLSYDTGVGTDYISAGIFEESGTIYTHSRTSAGTMKAASNAISAGSWKYLTLVRSSSTVYGYIDGVPMSTTGTTGADFNYSSNGTVFIGGSDNDAGGGTSLLNGKVDDVKIYNYARTQKQIVEDMNAGHPAPGSPVGSAIGHWKFDEGFGTTANNSGNQGSTLNGTLTSMSSPATATSGWTNSGKFGKALVFDGTNDLVNLGTPSSLNISGDLTISGWINSSLSSSTIGQIVININAATNNSQYQLELNRTAGKLGFLHGTTPYFIATGNTTLSSSTWYHVAAVRTGSTGAWTVKLYVNGQLDSTTTGSVDPGAFANPSIGGIALSPTTQPFNGSIDEVKIYNYALTADEVKVDMNRSSSQVLGSLSDKSTYEKQAANQEYCVPGDTISCAAPVGDWKFEENQGVTTFDTSGNASNGTWSGTLGSQWTQGKFGSGVKFNGSNNYVDIDDPSSGVLDFGTGDFTLSAWIKTSTTGVYQDILDKRTAPNGYLMGILNTNKFGSFAVGGGNNVSVIGDTTVTDGKWHYVAATFDRDGNASVYVDGKSDATPVSMTTVGTVSTTGKAIIGYRDPAIGSVWSYFNGQIDQVRAYNYLRTPAQIAWEYNKGAPVGHWKFDECQGDRANDSSGNNNTGTITPGSGGQTAVGTCTGSAGTLWKDGVNGKYNSSLDFDGTDDYVNTPYHKSSGDGAVSLWFKAGTQTSGSSSGIRPMIMQGEYWHLSMGRTGGGNDGKIITRWGSDGNVDAIITTSTYNDGNWHHAILTKTSTTQTLYIDGKSVGTATAEDTLDAGNFFIGGSTTNSVRYFTGQLDDVQIYNYALTSTQIKTLMNQGGAVRFGPVTGTP